MTIGRVSRYRWNAADVPSLALEFSSAVVRLMGRSDDGTWQELGAATPGAGDFAERIDALRVEALVRGRGPVPVELWLPPDQVLVRNYELPGGVPGRAEALRRLAAETGYPSHALSLAVSPAPAGGSATVLAALSQTVAEAREHAERWGFQPGRVSTRVEACRFGADGPAFAPVPTLTARAVGAAAASAASIAAVAFGVAAWGLLGMPGDRPPAPTGAELVLARIDATPPGLQRAAFTEVSRRTVQSLPAIRPGAGRAANDRSRIGALIASPDVRLAPVLAQPSTGVPMRVGSGPVLPRHLRPGGLERLAVAQGQANVKALVLGIDRIRETARSQGPDDGRPPAVLATATALGPRLPVSAFPSLVPVWLPGAESATAAKAAAIFLPASATDRATRGPATILLAAAEMAPRRVPSAPLPRPETDSAPAAPAPGPEANTVAIPAPRPEGGTRGETGARRQTGGQTGRQTAKGKPAATAEVVSDIAATTTPRPPVKPEQKARRVRQKAQNRAIAAGNASPSAVRTAASKHGLELDGTNLIGVLDARSGRQALLRTSRGDFVKVGRGDTVDGWRVSAINRDSVRLTHGSQSRTLLLIVR